MEAGAAGVEAGGGEADTADELVGSFLLQPSMDPKRAAVIDNIRRERRVVMVPTLAAPPKTPAQSRGAGPNLESNRAYAHLAFAGPRATARALLADSVVT